jgi:hypothetical protein
MVPDSFVCVWTIEQRNVVRWLGINADIDDRKPVAQKTVKDERHLRAISKRPKQRRARKGPDGITVGSWDCMSI